MEVSLVIQFGPITTAAVTWTACRASASNGPRQRSMMWAELLGETVGRWAAQRDERILVIATGGLTHNPDIFFPPADVVPEKVRPAIAPFLTDDAITDESLHIHPDWGPGVPPVARQRRS